MNKYPASLQIIQHYREFTRAFGINSVFHTCMLIGGGVITSLLELAGLSILFPLISLILQPDYMHSSSVIRTVSHITGITSPAQMTALIGVAIAVIFITKNALQIIYLSYEKAILTRWRVHITSNMYSMYMNTDYENFMRHSSSHMINLISQSVPYIVTHFIHRSLTLLNYFLTGVVIMIFILATNWIIAVMLMATGILVIKSYSLLFRKTTLELGHQSHHLAQKQFSLLQQAFTGYKETQSHLRENYFSQQFMTNAKELAKTDGKLLFIENLPLAAVELTVILLLIGMFQILILTNSNITLAATQIGIIVFASVRMIPIINRSIVSLVMINSSAQSLNKVMSEINNFPGAEEYFRKNHISSIHQKMDDAPIEPLPFHSSISLNNLSYTYPEAENPTLSNINLTIKAGEFIGISGASGGGKSTLVNILLGFLTNFKGTYKVDETKITAENIRNLRKIIGFVDQQIFMMDASIAENVAYGIAPSQIDHARVKSALQKAQAWDFVKKLPEGANTLVGENGKNLSGGQRQRIAIARAFYRDLKILVLDEASASLDVETEHKFFTYLKTLKGDLTVIMVAHRLSTLKECNRIIFMQNGQISDEGTFTSLSHSNAKFQEYIKHSNISLFTSTNA
ncbi:MAG: ABC transporter ATP-binding protein [Blastochloris viridis]|uniref:ABC transporter ATP-binding protein n=1 Tax=Blastochloris viridis TaxID=1079 RepID=A0A6N4RBT6_BLAVI|nr:MAG: ABC transporter ATP-binding protein [Blastochloris viridis]